MADRRLTTIATYAVLCLAGSLPLFMPESLSITAAGDRKSQSKAIFRTSGPVVDAPGEGRFADAMLESVSYPNGRIFRRFVQPAAVTGFRYAGPPSSIRVITGHDSAGGGGVYRLEDGEGDSSNVSEQDMFLFNDRILAMCQARNLNSYLDLIGGHPYSFVIELSEAIRDDDESLDDVGELVVFERGTGTGNSWIQLEVLDDAGHGLGTPLVVSPHEMVSTRPPTRVGLYDEVGQPRCVTQEIGGTAIDLTRLGVTEARYIRVSNPIPGRFGFQGGETAADLSIYAVRTTP